MEYDFEENKIIKEIRKRGAKRILIQLPEGIKKEGFRIVENIKNKSKIEVFISGGSCWGGCDLDLEEAKKIKADLIVHFGHTPFIKTKFPVLYIELRSSKNWIPSLNKELNKLKIKKIGLVSSVQYIDKLNEIKEFLEKKDKKIIIPKKKGAVAYDGQIIGCEYKGLKLIENKIEGVLVLGNKFHALGAALTLIEKPVYLLNENTERLELMDKERDKILKQRAISLERVRRANKIGILVDEKPGQYHLKSAENLKRELEKIGKKVIIIIVKEFNPDNLINFYDVEGFIDTACPRIAVEDYGRYERPIINSREAQVLLGKISWKGLLEKGLVGF